MHTFLDSCLKVLLFNGHKFSDKMSEIRLNFYF